jgi:hypothetical protein
MSAQEPRKVNPIQKMREDAVFSEFSVVKAIKAMQASKMSKKTIEKKRTVINPMGPNAFSSELSVIKTIKKIQEERMSKKSTEKKQASKGMQASKGAKGTLAGHHQERAIAKVPFVGSSGLKAMEQVRSALAKSKRSRRLQRNLEDLSTPKEESFLTGMASCPCIAKLMGNVSLVDCSYDWAYQGKCVVLQTVTQEGMAPYPGDYGVACKTHKEPGSDACFDTSSDPPVEKPPSQQADWCNGKWCYIDPCSCDAMDATMSDYFPGSLSYSYSTCGDKNTYTAVESSMNTVGNAKCLETLVAPPPQKPPAPSPASPPGPAPSGGLENVGCAEKCPELPAMIAMLMEMQGGQEAMLKICPQLSTVKCVAETPECDDGHISQVMADMHKGLNCICTCPSMVEMDKLCIDMTKAMQCYMGSKECIPNREMEKEKMASLGMRNVSDMDFEEHTKKEGRGHVRRPQTTTTSKRRTRLEQLPMPWRLARMD